MRVFYNLCFIIVIYFFTLPCMADGAEGGGFWRSLYGKSPSNAIDVGAFVLHFHNMFQHHAAYPMVGITYRSFNVMYFNNSFEKPTVSFSLERSWVNHPLSTNFAFNLNYRLGVLLGGYCFTPSLKCKQSSDVPVIPAIQIMTGFSYKKHAAVTLSWMGVILSAGFQYRF